MILFESRRVRRVIGRLERGERLPDALAAIAEQRRITTGWVTGLGAFEWVELAEYDQSLKEYRPPKRIAGPCEILSLVGNVSFKDGAPFVHAHVTVSRETEHGIEVSGGHLIAGCVFACELFVECCDDLGLRRDRDDATGLALWSGLSLPVVGGFDEGTAQPAVRPPVERAESGSARAQVSRSVSWADAAAASQRREQAPQGKPRDRPRAPPARQPAPARGFVPDPLPERRRVTEEEFLAEPVPQRGDWVDHQTFGLCPVQGEDHEGGIIIRLPSGVRKAIKLDVLEVSEPRVEEGRRIFPLAPRRR